MDEELGKEIDDVYSEITQTINSISLEVRNGEVSSSIVLTVNGEQKTGEIAMSGVVTFKGLREGTTTIDGGWITTNSITADQIKSRTITADEIATGTITASEIKSGTITSTQISTGSISFYDLNTSAQNRVTNAANTASSALSTASDAYNAAQAAQDDADTANDVLKSWGYNGRTTYIDGSNIYTGTVMAGKLIGGTVYLYDSSENTCGYIYLRRATSSSYAVEMDSNSSLQISAANTLYLSGARNGASIMLQSDDIQTVGNFHPGNSGTDMLGKSSNKWSDLYVVNEPWSESDEKLKRDIEPLDDRYLALIDNIQPVRFRRTEREEYGRYHTGFIAQDVEKAMELAGIGSDEFAGWGCDIDESGLPTYMLRYGEFVAILLQKIKQLEKKVEAITE